MANILAKIDRGEGTLGELVNSPAIANELEATLQGARETLISVQATVEQIRSATVDLPPTMKSVRKVADEVAELSVELRESARRFPAIAEDLRVVAQNLKVASESFPQLAVETQRGVREATTVFDAAGKTIFLRGYVDQSTAKLPAAIERVDSSIDRVDAGAGASE
jgi:hypothetical protein